MEGGSGEQGGVIAAVETRDAWLWVCSSERIMWQTSLTSHVRFRGHKTTSEKDAGNRIKETMAASGCEGSL